MPSIWRDSIRRSSSDEIRKEDEVIYHPETKEELIEAIKVLNIDEKQMDFGKPETLEKMDLSKITGLINIKVDYSEFTEDNRFTERETKLLQMCVVLPFKVGSYNSLDDILTKLGVQVNIEPGIQRRAAPLELYKSKIFWEDVIKTNKDACDAVALDDAKKALEDIKEKITTWESMPLRGEYLPDQKIINLYPDEMKKEYDGEKMDELLVTTLTHETMHAYFDRPMHDHLPYVASVEEPMAEFGMLLFLHETNSNYYGWAYTDVSDKKTCYRYGAAIMDQYLRDSQIRKDLIAYKADLF